MIIRGVIHIKITLLFILEPLVVKGITRSLPLLSMYNFIDYKTVFSHKLLVGEPKFKIDSNLSKRDKQF